MSVWPKDLEFLDGFFCTIKNGNHLKRLRTIGDGIHLSYLGIEGTLLVSFERDCIKNNFDIYELKVG